MPVCFVQHTSPQYQAGVLWTLGPCSICQEGVCAEKGNPKAEIRPRAGRVPIRSNACSLKWPYKCKLFGLQVLFKLPNIIVCMAYVVREEKPHSHYIAIRGRVVHLGPSLPSILMGQPITKPPTFSFSTISIMRATSFLNLVRCKVSTGVATICIVSDKARPIVLVPGSMPKRRWPVFNSDLSSDTDTILFKALFPVLCANPALRSHYGIFS